ncbi:MAG: CIS tube protein [Thermoanaerobaculia bacterium]
MERVAFLVEQSGARIPCLLNPESVVLRRASGVRSLRSVGGLAGAHAMADDPLLHTGGGTTEIVVDLLFDVSLVETPVAEGAQPVTDVRTMTLPLWQLTEHSDPARSGSAIVRFVWGKTWNIRAVIAALAERLEYFDADGAPGRSWLRMRMLRVDEPDPQQQPAVAAPQAQPGAETQVVEVPPPPATAEAPAPESPEEAPEPPPQRLDELAYQMYGDSSLWKLVAAVNGVIDPFHIPAGLALRFPPLTDLMEETR